MAYSSFTMNEVKKSFKLQTVYKVSLLKEAVPFQLSTDDVAVLSRFWSFAKMIGTEKALSEYMIAPLLAFCVEKTEKSSLFSGFEFVVDDSLGLNGVTDFLMSQSTEQDFIEAPVIVLVESKKGELKKGHGQCAATMVAAQKFNEQQEKPLKTIWGICTTGMSWQFLKLEDKTLWIDIDEYHIPESLEKIVGIIVGLLNQPNP